MKNILVTLFASLGLMALMSFAVPQPSISAASVEPDFCKNADPVTGPSVCREIHDQTSTPTKNPIVTIIKAAIEIISIIVGAAAVITIIVSGLRLIFSNGDPSAAASARTGLIYALIGVAVVVLSQTIVIFVLSKF